MKKRAKATSHEMPAKREIGFQSPRDWWRRGIGGSVAREGVEEKKIELGSFAGN